MVRGLRRQHIDADVIGIQGRGKRFRLYRVVEGNSGRTTRQLLQLAEVPTAIARSDEVKVEAEPIIQSQGCFDKRLKVATRHRASAVHQSNPPGKHGARREVLKCNSVAHHLG